MKQKIKAILGLYGVSLALFSFSGLPAEDPEFYTEMVLRMSLFALIAMSITMLYDYIKFTVFSIFCGKKLTELKKGESADFPDKLNIFEARKLMMEFEKFEFDPDGKVLRWSPEYIFVGGFRDNRIIEISKINGISIVYDDVNIRYTDENNHLNSVNILCIRNKNKLKYEILKKTGLLQKAIQPYIDAGIIKTIVFEDEYFFIANMMDKVYALIAWDSPYLRGLYLDKDEITEILDDCRKLINDSILAREFVLDPEKMDEFKSSLLNFEPKAKIRPEEEFEKKLLSYQGNRLRAN